MKIFKNRILVLIMSFMFIILVLLCLKKFDILSNSDKLKGSVPIYKTYSVGEEFCLGTECFYVIEDNGNKVRALAKYNLYVGYIWEEDNTHYQIEESAEGYGLQNSATLGRNIGYYPFVGTIWFSRENYWVSNDNLISDYGNGYPAYVYDDNSSLYTPLNNYEIYLKNHNYDSVKVSMLKYEDATRLGCNIETQRCSENNNFIYNTSYWLGSAYDNDKLYYIIKGGFFDVNPHHYSNDRGIRPVIEIEKKDFAEVIDESNRTYNVGDLFCLDTECFYTISDNGDTVTGLAKYNLSVGQETSVQFSANDYPHVISSSLVDNSTDDYGLQSKKTLLEEDKIEMNEESNEEFVIDFYGTVAFAEYQNGGYGYWTNSKRDLLDKYKSDVAWNFWVYDENSEIYKYIQMYKNKLKERGYQKIDVTMLSFDQLIALGCYRDGSDFTCESAPEFLSGLAYWTGSGYNYQDVWTYGIDIGVTYYYIDYMFGIRPVVTVSKTDLEKQEETTTVATTKETTEQTTMNQVQITTTKLRKKNNVKPTTIISENNGDIYLNGNEIPSDILEKVKGTDRNIILTNDNFKCIINGRDIDETTNINFDSVIKSLSESEIKNNIDISDAIVIEFGNNNTIPKTKVELNVTNNILNHMGSDDISIYRYNNKLTKIADKMNVENNKLTFTIDKLGTYVLTDKEIINKVSNDTKLIKENTNAKNNYIWIIIPISLFIILIGYIGYKKSNS